MTRFTDDGSHPEWDAFEPDFDNDLWVENAEQPPPPARPEVYSLREVAEMFGRTKRTVNNWVRAGRLQRGGFGKVVIFSRESIEAFLRGGQDETGV